MSKVDIRTLLNWIQSGTVALIDVRELEEHVEQSIPDDVHIPLGRIDMGYFPAEDFKDYTQIVFYCRSGMRSATACMIVQQMTGDVERYFTLEGGILEWKSQKCPIIQGHQP